MSAINPSKDSTPPENRELEVQTAPRDTAKSPLRPKSSTSRWLSIGGLLLLLLGLGLGWRWFQGLQASQKTPQGGGPAGIPVTLATTKIVSVQQSSEYVGSLESRRSVVLKPEITGRISDILVKAGDRVQTGDPLVQLKPEKRESELASALAQVNSARANRTTALSELQAQEADRIAKQAEVDLQNDEYRRISVLVREGAFAQQRLDQVERDRRRAISELRVIDKRIQAARSTLAETEAGLQQAKANSNLATEQLSDTTIVAPFNGVVGDIPVRLGQVVETSDTLTTVTQNDTLELNLSVPVERGSDLRPGLPVNLVNAQGKALARGEISFISPQANNRAQSILVKARFNNAAGNLRDGQFVRAKVVWEQNPGILVPTSAISRLGGETFVFVAQPLDDTCKEILSKAPQAGPPGGASAGNSPSLVARQRLVKLGSIQGNSYQVLEGLKPNEQIVTTGILNLSECAPIAQAPQQTATR